MALHDHAKDIFGAVNAALRINRRLHILLAVAVMILAIQLLAPVVGGGIASLAGLAALFLILPHRRRHVARRVEQ